MKNVLCFGAHPDDIELCMGGTVRKLVLQGYSVHIVIGCVPTEVERRREEAKQGIHVLGTELMFIEEGIGRNMGAIFQPTLVQATDQIIREIQPDIIFTHWNQDPHEDHIALTKAVLASARLTKADIYMYSPPNHNVYNSTSFSPNVFTDITETFEDKIRSIQKHMSQVGDKERRNWIKKIEAHSNWLGSVIDTEYAEGFILLRKFNLE